MVIRSRLFLAAKVVVLVLGSEYSIRGGTRTPTLTAFAQFVASKADNELASSEVEADKHWNCCGQRYIELRMFHSHVSKTHSQEIQEAYQEILKNGCHDSKWSALKPPSCSPLREPGCEVSVNGELALPQHFTEESDFPWLPRRLCRDSEEIRDARPGGGKVLLFYKYREIPSPEHVQAWQTTICERLNLTGKIRVATEGINGTVAGQAEATRLYVDCFLKHPWFSEMTVEDFKVSDGSCDVFADGLRVGIYQEIVPMGIRPADVSYRHCAQHLTPDEFHEALEDLQHKSCGSDCDRARPLLIDCRNFYESKIGHFEGALCPDIRKFSYWPEYVDRNRDMFEDRKVFMYCTGGIRCERGSAYLLQQGLCDSVYQLKGGIHKYIEKYPDGFFRGKMFVFDDRYHIQANEDILSKCGYCGMPWDRYTPCSTPHCHQLVLSCQACQEDGHTACCHTCQRQDTRPTPGREECDCTRGRPRIPIETLTVPAAGPEFP